MAAMTIRRSIAPRVVDNTLAMGTLASTGRFSVRVGDTNTTNNAPLNLANRSSDDTKILATFIWKDLGRKVELAGSFDDWRKHGMEYIPSLGYHVLVVELPPGAYYYRFVVDGRWKIAEDDENLKEDCFGEWSHYLEVDKEVVEDVFNRGGQKRFSTAVVSRVGGDVGLGRGSVGFDEGVVSDESESESEEESDSEEEDVVLPPRQRGEEFVADYDDDACGDLDLQADVFEAMKDVKESAVNGNFKRVDGSGGVEKRGNGGGVKSKSKRGKRLIRQLFKTLFGKDPYGHDGDYSHDGLRDDKENIHGGNNGGLSARNSGKNQKKHAMLSKDKGGRRGLKVWFPKEKNFPGLKSGIGRKVTPAEAKDVVDVDQKALFYNQVEENAKNRQLLGKTLYAQGKYDAALAMFSLSVKLREDNGLRNAKTTAIAHTDVASAFIHLDDAKNAEKHLMIAKKVFEKACFSGGKPNLGDVHCFLGVVMDMTDQLEEGANHYRRALDLYEECHAQEDNPNWATAIDNLKVNLHRQKTEKHLKPQPSKPEQPSRKSIHRSAARLVSNARRMSKRMSSRLLNRDPPQQQQSSFANQTSQQQFQKPLINAKAVPPTSNPTQKRRQQKRKPPAQPPSTRPQPGRTRAPPPPPPPAIQDAEQSNTSRQSKRQSSRRRNTWRELAETARASISAIEAAVSGGDGSYEGLSRQWQRDGREKMAAGQYGEAKDILTLAIYTRKRHGPWKTLANAECHEDLARVLFALSCEKGVSKSEAKNIQKEAAGYLRACVELLQDLDGDKPLRRAGEVWGNLGLVLDRMGEVNNAETAHTRSLVCYGMVGLSRDDSKWKKSYRNWKKNLDRQGKNAEAKWTDIQMQIAGKGK